MKMTFVRETNEKKSTTKKEEKRKRRDAHGPNAKTTLSFVATKESALVLKRMDRRT
tara:strand:- start:108 stop:275 length:168 start_codon:yes stop_codon:yes gene_type:complete